MLIQLFQSRLLSLFHNSTVIVLRNVSRLQNYTETKKIIHSNLCYSKTRIKTVPKEPQTLIKSFAGNPAPMQFGNVQLTVFSAESTGSIFQKGEPNPTLGVILCPFKPSGSNEEFFQTYSFPWIQIEVQRTFSSLTLFQPKLITQLS